MLTGGQLKRISEFEYQVKSQSRNGIWHSVRWINGKWSCTCEDFRKRGKECKHIYAVLLFQKLPEIILRNVSSLEIRCPRCGSINIIKKGVRRGKSGLVQKYLCKSCGTYFSDRECFQGLRHNPVAVVISLDLYYKNVSLRNIAHHLKQIYGIEVSHSTIHRWILRYITLLKKIEIQLKPKLGNEWQVDDMNIKFRGEPGYVWNVLDARSRYLIAMSISKGRSTEEALCALKKAVARASASKNLIIRTDKLKSYEKAMEKLRVANIKHVGKAKLSSPENNNKIERFNGTLRGWLRSKRVTGKMSENKTLDGFIVFYNLIRPHKSLDDKSPGEVVLPKGIIKPYWIELIWKAFTEKSS
ncbi:hypothetical protein DRO02_07780 [archaeon]|nr:MAG: hypothetical protein DRO02_07780 [archaeon]